MTGYRISRKELEALVDAHAPGWLGRARERTRKFRKLGRHEESSSIWSEVKAVYMTLQGASKCAFCERKLESLEYGLGEQAVEHFRPKGRISAWPLPPELTASGVAVTKPAKGGYHLLAYDLFNYSAACNPCNSGLKRDYFPVAGNHRTSGRRPEELAAEELPLLLYPIGDFDERPEDLIQFNGLSPFAVAKSGHKRHRALVTIEFFKLDSAERKNLLRERACVIVGLFPALQTLSRKRASESNRTIAQQTVDGFTSVRAPHTNCARSFERLFKSSRADAGAIYERAVNLIASQS